MRQTIASLLSELLSESFLGRAVTGRLSQTVLNALKDYLLNRIVTCDFKVKPSILFWQLPPAWRPLFARSLSRGDVVFSSSQ